METLEERRDAAFARIQTILQEWDTLGNEERFRLASMLQGMATALEGARDFCKGVEGEGKWCYTLNTTTDKDNCRRCKDPSTRLETRRAMWKRVIEGGQRTPCKYLKDSERRRKCGNCDRPVPIMLCVIDAENPTEKSPADCQHCNKHERRQES